MNALEWQKQIYLNGFAGKRLPVPVDFEALEAAARSVMSPQAYAYIAGGAGSGATMKANRAAFEAVKITPRMLRNVDSRDISIELLGQKYPSPLLLSPIGVLEMAHPEADLAVARAAANLQIPYIFSNQASFPMEETAQQMGDAPRLFQLYWSRSRDLVASLVKRAEKIGAKGIAVTLDTTILGWRTHDLDMAYLPFLEGKGIAQYTSDPVFQALIDQNIVPDTNPKTISYQAIMGLITMLKKYPSSEGLLSKLKSGRAMAAVRHFVGIYSNPALTWDDLAFLREQTSLPIFLKGILHPDDAQKALDYGMDGIFVSNHGGRQVDGSVSTFEMLPSIAKTVGGKVPILIDSGVRTGADVFKALAAGATGVCIGRPYVYGLAVAGQIGVQTVLQNLLADFELTMALAGCKSISEIDSSYLKF
jgi:lactate 2-monooxygenase